MAIGHFAAREIGRGRTHHSSARHGGRNDSGKAGGRRRSFHLNLALMLCLAPVLVTACGSATPAASSAGSSATIAAPTAAASGQASPSASAGSNIFASRLYGYSLVVPPGWQKQPADSSWLTVGLEGRCPSDWDCFTGSSGEPTLAAAAASVGADLTLDQWRSLMQVSLSEGCIDSAQQTATTLGGEPAQTWTTTCEGEGLHSTKVVALHAGRGYTFLFASPIGIGLETDRATLSSILTTLRFAPS
ncbi:MAG TPA: hypothetical protein VIM39_00120 [Candidatus Limnocylindrales bacterium]